MDASTVVARRALDLLEARDLPATPPVYELFYYFITDKYPRLTETINHLFSRGQAISPDDIEHLRAQYLPEIFGTRQLNEARATFEKTVGKTASTLDKAVEASGQFEVQLSDIDAALQTGRTTGPEQAGPADIASLTRSMQRTVATFREHLSDAQKEFAALKTELAKAKIESLTDSLTGVSNRRHFEDYIETQIARPDAEPISVIFADIDHFKTVNDRYGHLVGDQVLRLIATTIRHAVREADFVARLGGEEFVVVLPGASPLVAGELAENIRTSVASKTLVRRTNGERIGNVTLSFGIATFKMGMTSGELLRRADDCLYAAKRNGRNCVVVDKDLSAPRAG